MQHNRPLAGAAVVTAVLTATSIVPAVAMAQEPGMAEFRTAAEHASLAVEAQERQQVQMHLQHVINCLEGEGGEHYRADAGDPCEGRGALNGLPQDSVNRIRAQKIIGLAEVAVTFQHFEPPHYTAQAIQAVFQEDPSI